MGSEFMAQKYVAPTSDIARRIGGVLRKKICCYPFPTSELLRSAFAKLARPPPPQKRYCG